MADGKLQNDTPCPEVLEHARDWAGPDDPENPRNFSLLRRISSTVCVTSLAFVTTFGASIYSPGISEVSSEFNVSEEVAILPLSLYTVGLALGPLPAAPLCETFGRKIVFLSASPLFAAFTLGAGFSQDILTLVVCRFLAGVFAAPAVGNASATIIDYTADQYRAVVMSFYYAIPTLGAVLGPLVGGFVVQGRGWRWTQWTILLFLVTAFIPVLFTRETYKRIILQRRAKKLGIEGPPTREWTTLQLIQHFATTQLIRPLHMLATEPIVTLVCVYNGFLFGLMYLFIVASPWIYQTYYGFGTAGQSLSFLGLIIGNLIAPCLMIIVDTCIYQPRLKVFRHMHPIEDRFPPEYRLYSAMMASFILPAALLAFAWSTRPDVHWIVPILFQCLIAVSSTMIYAPSNLFMMDTYGPLFGASAAGAAMMSRYTLAASFPMFALKLYRGLGVGWATSLLAFCTLALAPVPFLFWKCGEKLRMRTRYETSN